MLQKLYCISLSIQGGRIQLKHVFLSKKYLSDFTIYVDWTTLEEAKHLCTFGLSKVQRQMQAWPKFNSRHVVCL